MQRAAATLTASALGMGVMLSPESLSAVGRSAGGLGSWVPAAILAAALLHRAVVSGYSEGPDRHPPERLEALVIRGSLGGPLNVASFLCSRLLPAVVLSTAILATAGFVFNEVFVVWFPNFAFAGLLLAGILTLNFFSDSLAVKLQAVLAAAVLLALVALSLVGLGQGIRAGGPGAGSPVPLDFHDVLAPVMILIGYDLARLGFQGEGAAPADRGKAAMVTALLAPAVVLGLWAWVSTLLAPADRLAESTIPHMIAARAAAGEWGRMLMGAAVLSGAAAVINGFFVAMPRLAVGMASTLFGPPPLSRVRGWRRTVLLALGLAIAGMLFLGLAGDSAIDVWLRAGMLLWVLGTLLVPAAAPWRALRSRAPSTKPFREGSSWMKAAAVATLFMSLIILIVTDQERMALAELMTGCAAACLVAGFLVCRVFAKGA